MASFFEKLKKGMGIEEGMVEEALEEEGVEEKIKKATKPQKEVIRKKIKIASPPKAKKTMKPKKLEIKEVEMEEEPLTMEPKIISPKEEREEPEEKAKIFEAEGQLAIDVYQTKNDLVIQSAIAGVRAESLDIILENDVITVKGVREKPFEEEGEYFAQECFWGPFSREIILPAEVDPNRVSAELKEGVLTIRVPKLLKEKRRKIIVRG